MRQFIIGTSGAGPASIEWDTSTGELVVRLPGIPTFSGVYDSLKQGMVGGDEIAWQGRNFRVMKYAHDHFKAEFPQAQLEAEYMLADEWCQRKNKKIVNSTTFMTNWLKRARGGLFNRGGVVL